MDNRKLFLADLKSGELGKELADIQGSLLFSSFYNAGLSRMDLITDDDSAQEVGIPYRLYIDEAAGFQIKNLEHSLRELRKFNVHVILALQQK